jgi:hypothetical protein
MRESCKMARVTNDVVTVDNLNDCQIFRNEVGCMVTV